MQKDFEVLDLKHSHIKTNIITCILALRCAEVHQQPFEIRLAAISNARPLGKPNQQLK